MSQLGDLLELLHSAHERPLSVTATIEHWSDPALSSAAMDRWAKESRGGVIMHGRDDQLDSQTIETFRIWHRQPGNFWRVEEKGGKHVTITNGRRWWSNDMGDRYWTNIRSDGTIADNVGGGTPRPILETIFHPALVTSMATLNVTGQSLVAGRETVIAEGVLRAQRGRGIFALGSPYADNLRLQVDAVTGALLGVELYLQNEPFMRWSVTEITYDLAMDDSLFVGPGDAFFPFVGQQSVPKPTLVWVIVKELGVRGTLAAAKGLLQFLREKGRHRRLRRR